MSSTHPEVYTTEWDEAQIKLGNYAPYEKEITQDELSRQFQDTISDKLEVLQSQIKADDASDVDADLINIRKERLSLLRDVIKRNVFGSVYDVNFEEYVTKVTDASESADVVLLLYSQNSSESEHLLEIFSTLARRYSYIKFCKGLASNLVPTLTDDFVPAVLIYKKKQCVSQLFRPTLFENGQILPSQFETLVIKNNNLIQQLGHSKRSGTGDDESDSDSSDHESASTMRTVANDKTYSDVNVDKFISLLRK